MDAIYDDDAFADRAAHQVNKWAAITQWIAYNLAGILIFTVNSIVHKVE